MRRKCNSNLVPPPLDNIERVTTMTILGVTINDRFSLALHVQRLLHKGYQTLYGLKVLKAHGLCGQDLHNVAESLLFGSIFYACPAWRGFLTLDEVRQIDSIIRKSYKWGFFRKYPDTFNSLADQHDTTLFKAILSNPNHSLHHLLPPSHITLHNLRPRSHDRTLTSCTTLQKKNFIQRMLFKDMY